MAGRPKGIKRPSLNITIEEEYKNWIIKQSEKLKKSRGEIVEMALEEYFKKESEK